MRRTVRFMAGLLLAGGVLPGMAACSREADSPPQEPAATAEPLALPSPSEPALRARQPGAIPAALRGRWGLVAADCTSTHGDAKGLLEIGARTLTFYESRATLQSVRAAGPERLRGTFAFSGEGQEWAMDVELRAWNDGAQLIRQDRGSDALPGPLTYGRCET